MKDYSAPRKKMVERQLVSRGIRDPRVLSAVEEVPRHLFVPQELQDIINANGGKLKQTWGVPVEEIQRGIKHGVRKINVDTDNRLAITGAIRKVFAESPGKFDPRDYLKPARAAMVEVVKARMTAFGQAGWADKVPHVTLEEMAKRYR